MNKNIVRQAGFGKEVETVEAGFCPFCKKPMEFKARWQATEQGHGSRGDSV